MLLVVGMVILRFVVGGVGEAVDHWRFVLPLFLSGLGMGAAIAPLFQTVLWTVPPRDAGSGSGALQSFQQIGSALGIADHRPDFLFLAGEPARIGNGGPSRLRRQHVGGTALRDGGVCGGRHHGVLSQPARAAPGSRPWRGRGEPGCRRGLSQHPLLPGDLSRSGGLAYRERGFARSRVPDLPKMSLWIPITIAAAFLQNVRSALQKHLKGVMGTTGATFVRFGYGFPFSLAFVYILNRFAGYPIPAANARFLMWTVVGGLTQIFATALLIHLVLVPQLCGRHRLFAHRAGTSSRIRPAVPRRDGDARGSHGDRHQRLSASC